jgi:hypothetical protein
VDNYELHMKTHTCHDDCQNPICVAVRKAVEAEREACAKVCDEFCPLSVGSLQEYEIAVLEDVAAAIRARGNSGL